MNNPKTVDEIIERIKSIAYSGYKLDDDNFNKQVKKEILEWHKQEIVGLLDGLEREIDEIDMNLSQSPMRIIVLVKQKIQELKGEGK